MAGKSGRKRKKDKNSPNSGADTPVNKRTMADSFNYSLSPTGLTQTQAGQFNSPSVPQTFQYVPNMYNQMQPAMMMPQNVVRSPVAQGVAQGGNNCGDQHTMGLILQRLDNMDKKLGQISEIQTSMSKITVKVNDIEDKVGQLESKVRQIESSRDFDTGSMDQINAKQKEIDSLMKRMQKLADDQTEKDASYKSQILDMQCRSMRDNLMFYRIPEERGETDDSCVEKVLGLIEDVLGIENARDTIKLHRAHRIGKFNASKIRPIVAKFAFFPDREKVRTSAGKLKGTEYGISQQFPREIMDKRRELVPIMKKARSEGKDAYLVVDKLYIDKVLYKSKVPFRSDRANNA